MTNPFSAILSACAGPVALFADFDGTLVEIAPTPDAIVVPGTLIASLAALEKALDGAFAIITGRTIANIDGFLSSRSFSIAGGHGAERRHQGSTTTPLSAHADAAGTIGNALVERFRDDERILIERKPAGVAVHFRAAPERGGDVRAAMDDALADARDFHAIEGKKVIEARPRGADKGAAIAALMEKPPFKGRLPVFIGDDVTDEDGFRAIKAMGGIGIKVGAGETAARFRLADVASVHTFLDLLARGARQVTHDTHSREATK